jgi:hypothetical protein
MDENAMPKPTPLLLFGLVLLVLMLDDKLCAAEDADGDDDADGWLGNDKDGCCDALAAATAAAAA